MAGLLVCHLCQPATYVVIFYVYAPLLWSISKFLSIISFVVPGEVYAGFTL